MRLYSSIALAAVAAVLVTPVAAEAKTKKHHVAAPATEGGLTTAEQLRLAQEQISQLQAQLNAVAAKLDATAASTTTQVAAANTAATSAATKADKALAAADAVKVAEVKTEKAVSLSSWAQGTKVGGQIFFNTSAITANGYGATGNTRKTLERDGAFQIKRAYLTFDHTFNKTFSVDVTADAESVVGSKTVDNGGNNAPAVAGARTVQGLFLKYAYLQATIDPALVIKLGSAAQPWIPFVDGIEGHRYIDKNLTDQFSYGNSADWGVHVGGTLFNKILSYDVAAVNGAGFRSPQNTNHIDLEGRVSASYAGFTAGIGGYTGKLAASNTNTIATNATIRTASRLDALVAYQGKIAGVGFSVGGEYLFAKNFSDKIVDGVSSADKARGEAIFGSITPFDKWSVFGRYNWVRSNALTHPQKADHAFFTGVQYEPVKGLDLALVYKHDSADGYFSGGNYNGFTGGNISSTVNTGGTTTGTPVSRSEIGLYGNVKF